MDSGEKPEFFRSCEEEVCVMPVSKYSPEFKEYVVAEVLEGSRSIADSGEVLQSGAGELWISWVRIWRKRHPDSDMEGASQDQVAEIERLQAELCEAGAGDWVFEKSGGFRVP